MTFIKQLMLIGSGNNTIETSLAYNINFSFDMDDVLGKASFNLPYIKFSETGDVDLTQLKKKDIVKIFFGSFEENPGDISIGEYDRPSFDSYGEQIPINGMYLVFDGIIERITLEKTKGNYNYTIECDSSLGIGRYSSMTRTNNSFQYVEDMLITNLQLAGLMVGEISRTEQIDARDIFRTNDLRINNIELKGARMQTNGGNNLIEEFNKVKEKYAMIIHQTGDGLINVTAFSQIVGRNDINLIAWEFRLNDNMFSLNYGDLTNNVNSIICLGRHPYVGYAVDPIAVQLNAGDKEVSKENYNYLIIERRDIVSDEACEQIAREELLKIMKDYTIQFKTLFNPLFKVTAPIIVYDDDKYSDGQIFFIKSYSVRIGKDDVSCDIIAYSNSISVLPEDLVLEPTGITDVDVIYSENELEDTFNWGNLE
jgi:hypothetical protein